jgi:hypothetical protein
VSPTCQTPLSASGPPGSAPLPRGCHVPHRSSALSTLSGPRAGVPTAPVPTGCSKIAAALPTPHRLTHPDSARPDRAITRSEADRRCPSAPTAAVRPSDAVASFVHGERRPSSPLTVLHPWSVELTSPSLLPITGPPSATVAPPRQKNAAAEPVFFPSPSTRSSGKLFPPSCPVGSLTAVGARSPPFAPPLPLWCRRRPRRDTRLGAVTAPACAAPSRATQPI